MIKNYIQIIILAMIVIGYVPFVQAQERSVFRDGKLYKGQEYDQLMTSENEKLMETAQEFATALLTKDRATMLDLTSDYLFSDEKDDAIRKLLKRYRKTKVLSGKKKIKGNVDNQDSQDSVLNLVGVEVLSSRLDDDLNGAEVNVRTSFSALNIEGGLSSAPLEVEKWFFKYINDDWLFCGVVKYTDHDGKRKLEDPDFCSSDSSY